MFSSCCCPETCVIATNDFASNIDNMTIVAGTPSVSGGLLPLSAGDLVVFDDGAASVDDGTHLTTGALTTDATATIRLLAAYSDASNYLFGEVSRASGAIKLRVGRRMGGVDEYLSQLVTVNDAGGDLDLRHTITLCYQPGAAQTSEAFSQIRLPQSGTGSVWTTPENITDLDSNNAVYNLSATDSEVLSASDFLFGITPGSTITGIGCSIQNVSTTGTGTVEESSVIVVYDSTSGTNEVIPHSISGTGNDYTWGGVGDLMGCTGITWAHVNDPTFAFNFTFVDTTDGDHISIDAVGGEIYFNSPDHAAGTLTLSYTNSSDSSVQCAKAYNVWPTGGLKGGFRDNVGSWNLDAATYSYLQSAFRPICPSCGTCPGASTVSGCPTCCDTGSEPYREYILDLGAGGWTDNSCCNGCEDVQGQFLLQFLFSDPNCTWAYSGSVIGAGTGDRCGVTAFLDLIVVSETQCRWTAEIFTVAGGDLIGTACATNPNRAYYESAPFNHDQCQTDDVELTKISDIGGLCAPGLPASIFVRIP